MHINSFWWWWWVFPFSQISPGHYGNTAGRCQDVGSLGVGVQLRPPPVFIHRRPPIPPPGPSLAGSVFLNRERSDSPLRFQNRPRTGGGGRQLTLKALFKQVFQLTTQASHAKVGLWSISVERLDVLWVNSALVSALV